MGARCDCHAWHTVALIILLSFIGYSTAFAFRHHSGSDVTAHRKRDVSRTADDVTSPEDAALAPAELGEDITNNAFKHSNVYFEDPADFYSFIRNRESQLRRSAGFLQELYDSLHQNAIKKRGGGLLGLDIPDYIVTTLDRARQQEKKGGYLGLDIPDYILTTLDKARKTQKGGYLGLDNSDYIMSTLDRARQLNRARMSSPVSVGALRRMLSDMMNAGR